MRQRLGTVFVLFMILAAPLARAQDSRDETREKLRSLLQTAGKRDDVNVSFRQSVKEPYNFIGTMDEKLKNADSLEIVIRVSESDTVGVRVYPHYKDKYINLDKVKDVNSLMRRLLHFNDENFFFWGADDTNDLFAGYTFTLESGFPEEAMTVVLRSIRSTDRFVGDLRPYIDGSASASPTR
ncbi:MAG TPA: hypothetical protein VJZ00_16600 [Thermoanaerobaculia bacterium]|nr:hypothetical protein [Thermoanaerobaculia bacterium]